MAYGHYFMSFRVISKNTLSSTFSKLNFIFDVNFKLKKIKILVQFIKFTFYSLCRSKFCQSTSKPETTKDNNLKLSTVNEY